MNSRARHITPDWILGRRFSLSKQEFALRVVAVDPAKDASARLHGANGGQVKVDLPFDVLVRAIEYGLLEEVS